MDGQPKTSFIPKKTGQVTPGSASFRPQKKKGRAIISLIATIIFLATLVALGGVYFYQFTLEKRIESQVNSLQKARDEFDERFVEDATRLNLRINSSLKLLENHVSPSSLFALLEEHTLQTVAFSNFSFSDTKDGKIQVNGSGQAQRFETIVLQSDAFGKSGFMRNVLFSNLNPNIDTGTVQFGFSATLDPRLILYRNSLPESFDANNIEN
jgi:uncharacterized membrane-anchored protein YhcB (DUF1043 family)